MKYPKIYLFFLFLGFAWSCESNPANKKQTVVTKPATVKKDTVLKESESKTAEKKIAIWYSPFVVDISSEKMAFDTISFKDVTQGQISSSRETTMETLADSLGMAIGEDPNFKAICEMRYDEEITKPSNHLACGRNHLYIDIWEEGDHHFGYSMWSGCSEDAEFAHSSVVFRPSDDPLERVAPLVVDIHRALTLAHSTKCFLKTC